MFSAIIYFYAFVATGHQSNTPPPTAPTCVGKVTYLSASYWHHELSMFDTAGKEYSYANAFDLTKTGREEGASKVGEREKGEETGRTWGS